MQHQAHICTTLGRVLLGLLAVLAANGQELATQQSTAVISAPTGVSASDGTVCGAVRISWNSVASATAYLVYCDGTFVSQATQPPYEHGIGNASVHSYIVQATNDGGASGLSSPDTGYAGLRTVSVVTTTNDSGPGSLRQAILEMSTACGGDITFSNLSGSITLTTGELPVSANINILGPGPTNLTISGNNASQVFTIASNATVLIAGLTIRDGKSKDGTNSLYPAQPGAPGGGVFNAGTLVLSNCFIITNRTGKGGSARYTGYIGGESGAGGGVYNTGSLTLSRCRISGNSCSPGANGAMDQGGDYVNAGGSGCGGGRGGGVYNAGTLTISDCCIASNCAGSGGSGGSGYSPWVIDFGRAGDGGAGGAGGGGGGLYNAGTLTLSCSTISGNAAGQGGAGGGW